MWTRRLLIHPCLIHSPFFNPTSNILHQLFLCFHMHLCQSINKNTRSWIFSYLKLSTTILILLIVVFRCATAYRRCWCCSALLLVEQEIRDLFHVNFEEANCYSKLSFIWIFFYVVENVVDTSRDYTWLVATALFRIVLLRRFTYLAAENCVGFSTTCLAICHYYTVVAI